MLNDPHNVARGKISASGNNGAGVLDTVSAPSHRQDWSLDALGNWSSLSTDGTAQSRTHNSQNQITSIQTQTTPTYDGNGDTTTDNGGQQYTFDAWNHIHAVKNAGGTTLVTYSYDATYRRIQEAPASGATTDLYYSASWQVLEERLSTHPSAPSTQMVWSPVYVDAMVLRDRDTNADGTLDERLYCLQDANFNVTSTLSTAGAIQERYRYDPYGAVTYLDSSFNSHASAYAWQYLHQGGRLDLVSGLYYFRNRDLCPVFGRWMQEDPLGYVDGGSLFLYEQGRPIALTDPQGLWGKDFHHDLTLEFATKAGIACAAELAAGCNRPDEDERDAVESFKMAAKLKALAAAARLSGQPQLAEALERLAAMRLQQAAEWHFPADPDGIVRPDSASANAKVDQGIKGCDFRLFSEGLHTLQDSWSHQGKPLTEGMGHGRGATTILGQWIRLNGLAAALSGSADKTAIWPSDARAAAMATYKKMLDFKRRCPCSCPGAGDAHELTSSGAPEEAGSISTWLDQKYPGDNEVD